VRSKKKVVLDIHTVHHFDNLIIITTCHFNFHILKIIRHLIASVSVTFSFLFTNIQDKHIDYAFIYNYEKKVEQRCCCCKVDAKMQ